MLLFAQAVQAAQIDPIWAQMLQYVMIAAVPIIGGAFGVLTVWIKSENRNLSARIDTLEEEHKKCMDDRAEKHELLNTELPSDFNETSRIIEALQRVFPRVPVHMLAIAARNKMRDKAKKATQNAPQSPEQGAT